MAGVNKAIIIGNLGRDPELRYTQGGQPVCRLSVATTRRYTRKNTNEQVEETEWHRVTVWGKQAEHCNNYLAKGRQVYIEGRLRTSSYEQDGVKKYSTEIVADTVQFLGGGGGGGGGGARSGGSGPGGSGGGSEGGGFDGGPEPYDGGDYVPPGPGDDDIPF